jgi:hypothetical protein
LKGLPLSSAAEPVTKVVSSALSSDAPVLIPRIPGIDDYLAALADAVRQAPADETAAKDALIGVAKKWEATTERLGRANQAAAYRRHLGLEELK